MQKKTTHTTGNASLLCHYRRQSPPRDANGRAQDTNHNPPTVQARARQNGGPPDTTSVPDVPRHKRNVGPDVRSQASLSPAQTGTGTRGQAERDRAVTWGVVLRGAPAGSTMRCVSTRVGRA
eukprot:2998448-Rhodomonas_salina.1